MAEIALGNGGEFIMLGLEEAALDNVYDRLKISGVDLAPFREADGLIDTVRGLSQEITDSGDPRWTEAVDALYDEVETTQRALTPDVIGDRYDLTKFGVSAPNPVWSKPHVIHYADGNVNGNYCGRSKYDFLGRQTLTRIVDPFQGGRQVKYDLQAVAVTLQLLEKPDQSDTDYSHLHSYGYGSGSVDRWLLGNF